MTRAILLALGGCAFVLGCSGNATRTASTAPVSGIVLLDNKPMAVGEIRFMVAGEPTRVLEVKDGAFAGDVFIGKNRVEVVLEKDGPPNPTDPKAPPMKVNSVADRYLAPGSPLPEFDIDATGKKDMKFECRTIRK